MKLISSKAVLACTAGLLLSSQVVSAVDVSAELQLDFNNTDSSMTEGIADGVEGTTTGMNSNSWGGDVSLFFKKSMENGDTMVQATTELDAAVDGSVGVAEASLQFGKKDAWDVKVGRFEAAELYKTGNDIVIATPEGSTATFVAGDARGAGAGSIMVQGHFGMVSTQLNLMTAASTYKMSDDADEMDTNKIGIRPAVLVKSGAVSAAVGMEMVSEKAQKPTGVNSETMPSHNNMGLNVVYDTDMLTAGLSYSSYANTMKEAKNTQGSVGFHGTYKAGATGDFSLGYHITTVDNGESGAAAVVNTSNALFLTYMRKIMSDSLGLGVGLSQTTANTAVDGTVIAEATGTALTVRFTQAI